MVDENHQLRAVRLETAALVFTALFPTVGTILYFVLLSEGAAFRISYFACKVIQFGFPVTWALLTKGRLERGWDPGSKRAPSAPASEPGRIGATTGTGRVMPWRGAAWGLLTGAGIAGAIGAGYLLVFRGAALASAASGRVAERLAQMGASTPWRYALLAIFISIAHSWLEEYYWRWFLFGRLRPLTGAGPAVLLSSLAFTSHHVVVLWAYLGSGPAAWMVLPLAGGVALGGAVWARLYDRTGSILPGWISHVLADLAIMAMGWDLALGAPLCPESEVR